MTEDIDTTHHLRQMLVRSIAVPVVLMAMVGVTLYWQVNQLLELNRWVDHSDQVIADANRVERMLVDRETGVRGFASTNEEVFLQPFSEAEEHLDEAFDELATAVRDQPDQLRRVVDRGVAGTSRRHAAPFASPRCAQSQRSAEAVSPAACGTAPSSGTPRRSASALRAWRRVAARSPAPSAAIAATTWA